jgi:transposase
MSEIGAETMRKRGRPKAELKLSDEEREQLERYARRGKTSQRLALRARIVLTCAKGLDNRQVAAALRVNAVTVCKWRSRFVSDRIEGLRDGPRSGAPRKIGDDQVEAVVVATLETMPRGASRWSTRLMAKKAGIGADSVSRIWRAFGLKPHRAQSFQLSTDPDFIDKVRDVVGLYINPPSHALVLSVDEKSQIQALNRTQPVLPMRPGQLERRTPEYQRNGTTSLLAALNVATGAVIGKCFRRHRTREFVKFLNLIDQSVDAGLDVHLIMDNYATHKAPGMVRWLAKHPRFRVHFTPTHSSWLNQIECWFSILTEKMLKRGSHHSTRELEAAIYEFLEVHNDAPRPFAWIKTADEILDKVAQFCRDTTRLHSKTLK